MLERTVKNAQNGLISREKIRLLAGGGKKNEAKKNKRRKFCWVRHNNQNPTLMDIDPMPPLQPTHLNFCEQIHSPTKPMTAHGIRQPKKSSCDR